MRVLPLEAYACKHVKQIQVKTILSKSKVFDYTINPYIGCAHGCTYCYARYMKRFTGHKEKWGEFVDVKINAPTLLMQEIAKKKTGRIWISGACDPYQPLEKEYRLTERCLEILSNYDWPVTIQTKSPLVRRDLGLLEKLSEVEVGLSITTGDEKMRRIFEPNSPTIRERIETTEQLHSMGIRNFVMIAPLLPKAEDLVEKLDGRVDYVLIDKMNYHYADWVYRKKGLEYAMTQKYLIRKKADLAEAFEKKQIPHQFLF